MSEIELKNNPHDKKIDNVSITMEQRRKAMLEKRRQRQAFSPTTLDTAISNVRRTSLSPLPSGESFIANESFERSSPPSAFASPRRLHSHRESFTMVPFNDKIPLNKIASRIQITQEGSQEIFPSPKIEKRPIRMHYGFSLNDDEREAKSKAAIKIQAWWRGRLSRMLLTAGLVVRRLRYGTYPKQTNIPKMMINTFPLDGERASSAPSQYIFGTNKSESFHPQLNPWPRSLVKSLAEFLGSLEDSVLYSLDNTQQRNVQTVAGIYNLKLHKIQTPFSFSLEKRALLQLKKSREAREGLHKKKPSSILES